MSHFIEEIETFLHSLKIFLVFPHLLFPYISLNDHHCFYLNSISDAIVPFSDETAIPFLDYHDFIKHLFNLPDANGREASFLPLVSPPFL